MFVNDAGLRAKRLAELHMVLADPASTDVDRAAALRAVMIEEN